MLEIRLLGPDDGAVLERVADDVFDNPVVPALTSEFLNDRRHHLIVAIHEGQVVGMITAVDYVHPDKLPPREASMRTPGVSPSRSCSIHSIWRSSLQMIRHGAGYAQVRSGVTPECVAGESPVELWRFYIAQPWHGRGMAQALMKRVELEAWRRGGRTLWLGVWEGNARAKAFYQKSGFIDVGSHLFMVGTDAQIDRILVGSLSR